METQKTLNSQSNFEKGKWSSEFFKHKEYKYLVLEAQ